MRAGAIDIHHHFVPEQVIEQGKRHGKALGVEVSEEKDGSIHFAFGGRRYGLQQGLTDVEPRLALMDNSRIAMAALDPSTNILGYDLRGEQAESWCRLYNQCVNEFLKKHPDRFTAMAAVPNSVFAARTSPLTSITFTTRATSSILSGPWRRISMFSSSCIRRTPPEPN